MPAAQVRRQHRPIRYRDSQDRVWSVSEVARLRVVSPSIDGPNVAFVIRFEREGEVRALGRRARAGGINRLASQS